MKRRLSHTDHPSKRSRTIAPPTDNQPIQKKDFEWLNTMVDKNHNHAVTIHLFPIRDRAAIHASLKHCQDVMNLSQKLHIFTPAVSVRLICANSGFPSMTTRLYFPSIRDLFKTTGLPYRNVNLTNDEDVLKELTRTEGMAIMEYMFTNTIIGEFRNLGTFGTEFRVNRHMSLDKPNNKNWVYCMASLQGGFDDQVINVIRVLMNTGKYCALCVIQNYGVGGELKGCYELTNTRSIPHKTYYEKFGDIPTTQAGRRKFRTEFRQEVNDLKLSASRNGYQFAEETPNRPKARVQTTDRSILSPSSNQRGRDGNLLYMEPAYPHEPITHISKPTLAQLRALTPKEQVYVLYNHFQEIKMDNRSTGSCAKFAQMLHHTLTTPGAPSEFKKLFTAEEVKAVYEFIRQDRCPCVLWDDMIGTKPFYQELLGLLFLHPGDAGTAKSFMDSIPSRLRQVIVRSDTGSFQDLVEAMREYTPIAASDLPTHAMFYVFTFNKFLERCDTIGVNITQVLAPDTLKLATSILKSKAVLESACEGLSGVARGVAKRL